MFLVLLWCNVGNAREYCFILNEKNQVFHKRTETIVSLITLDQELICLKKQMKQKFMNKGGKKL